jgi:hypothetical protein
LFGDLEMHSVAAREMPTPVETKLMGNRDELKDTSLSRRGRGLRAQWVLIGVNVKRRSKSMIAQGLIAAADKSFVSLSVSESNSASRGLVKVKPRP